MQENSPKENSKEEVKLKPVLVPTESARRTRPGGLDHTPLHLGEVRYVRMKLPTLRDMPDPPNTTSLTDRLNENPKMPFRHTLPFPMEISDALHGGEGVEARSPFTRNMAQLILLESSHRSDGALPEETQPLHKPLLFAFTIDRSRGVHDTRVRQILAAKMTQSDFLAGSLSDGRIALFKGDELRGVFTTEQLSEGGVFIEQEVYLTRFNQKTKIIELGRASVDGIHSPESISENPQTIEALGLLREVLDKDLTHHALVLLNMGLPQQLQTQVSEVLHLLQRERGADTDDNQRKEILKKLLRLLPIPILIVVLFVIAKDQGPIKIPKEPKGVPTTPRPVDPTTNNPGVHIPDERYRGEPNEYKPTPAPHDVVTVETGMYIDNIAEARLRELGFDTQLRNDLISASVISAENTTEDQRKFDLVWQRLVAVIRILYMVNNENTLHNPHDLRVGDTILQPLRDEVQALYAYFVREGYNPPVDFGNTNRPTHGEGDQLGTYIEPIEVVKGILRNRSIQLVTQTPRRDSVSIKGFQRRANSHIPHGQQHQ